MGFYRAAAGALGEVHRCDGARTTRAGESARTGHALRRAAAFRAEIATRCTVRDFSPRPVPREIIAECLRAAGTAPNGANLQPWHFAVIGSPEL